MCSLILGCVTRPGLPWEPSSTRDMSSRRVPQPSKYRESHLSQHFFCEQKRYYLIFHLFRMFSYGSKFSCGVQYLINDVDNSLLNILKELSLKVYFPLPRVGYH